MKRTAELKGSAVFFSISGLSFVTACDNARLSPALTCTSTSGCYGRGARSPAETVPPMSQIVPSMKPVFEGSLSPQLRAKARCSACQLQMCKSRFQGPHSALHETARDEAKNMAVYSCETCGVSLVWSGDMTSPGWSQRRDMSAN